MPSERVARRLAAILAADMVGYSRLMAADEAGTLARLKTLRAELIDPTIAGHEGRIVKEMGDGLLVEFSSVVDAVQCAMTIQRGVEAYGAPHPDDRRVAFRMGINIGDVIAEGGDIYGGGVNIAARLEQIAEPGGIALSEDAYRQVKDKLEVAFEDLGAHEAKNIPEPLRVYRVRAREDAPAAVVGAGERSPAVWDKPSIAVLPFKNMSADPEQEYFSDGISEDIIIDLSKIAGLFVIARNSTFVYKSKAVSVPQVSRELGVRHVLEGSVRKAGNRIRVTAQMVDGATGGHVWAERYDRDLTDIFSVQDELTREIVSALALKLTEDEQARLARRQTHNIEAYDLLLRAREQAILHTRSGTAEAQSLLERAIALDPEFAAAYAWMAFTHVQQYGNRWTDSPDEALRRCYELAQKAVDLDDGEPYAHFALAIASLWMRKHERALVEAERCIAIEPNSAEGHLVLGQIMGYAGRSEAAIEVFQKYMRLDPHYTSLTLHFLAQVIFNLERYDEAAAVLKRRLSREPNSETSRVLLAACCGHLGKIEEARAEWEEALRINPDYSFEHRRKVLPYKDPADFERIANGLRMAGLVK
ncbi:MAG: adenylate/guanylate cyclase domain-containing protein [Alphaproteobacteria bacterium]